MKFKRIIPLVSSLMLTSLLAPIISSCAGDTTKDNYAKINVTSQHGFVNFEVDGHQIFEEVPSIEFGKTVKVKVISLENYFVSSIVLDDEIISNSNIASFVVPEKNDISLMINYGNLAESSKLIINNTEHGSIKVKNENLDLNNIALGTTVEFDVVPDEGYILDKLTINEKDITDVLSYTFKIPNEVCHLDATFKSTIKATLEVITNGQGTVELDKNNDFYLGDKIKATIKANDKYQIDKIKFNDNEIKLESGKNYAFLTLNQEKNTLNVSFKEFTNTGFDYLYANIKIKPTRGSLGSYDDYYEPVRGLKGPELKAGLNKIIKNHVTFGYKTLNQTMLVTDADPFDKNKIILTYEGSFKRGEAFNKEHTWAKSVGEFGTGRGPGSDMHHLRPSNSTLNSKRSNFDFSKVNGGKDCGKDFQWGRPSMKGNLVGGQKFEPKDEFKGDVARMIFYMATRYEGGDGYLDLEVGSSKGTIDKIDGTKYYKFSGASGIHGSFDDLYEWATGTIDPVSDFEVNRNNLIDEKYQHNRNPFIDHPEFVQMIYDKNYNGPGALNDK